MTPQQCRMARAALKWKYEDLAAAAGIGRASVSRFELGVPMAQKTTDAMQAAFAKAGVQFAKRSGRVSVSAREDETNR